MLGAGATAPASAKAPDRGERSSYPGRVELPDGFQPEGITIGKRATAYFGSRLGGDLYAVDLPTGEGEVVSQGPGTSSVGLKVDRRERLFVSGGSAGDARVVDARSGELFRVDRESGEATRVDLGGTLLSNGDGLLLAGRTLYAVQNSLNKVAVLRLDKAGTSGTKVREITSPDFDVPTTVARLGRRLYLPNARFSTPPTPTTDYWVTQVSARP